MILRNKSFGYRLLAIMLSLAISAVLATPALNLASGQAAPSDVNNSAADNDAAPAFSRFVGANSFFNENPAAYEIVGNVREYHPWVFTEWTTGSISDENGNVNDSIKSMNPQATFVDSWYVFDDYYKNMSERGIEVTICVHGTMGDRQRPDYQDPDGTRSEYPSSYLGHAQSMFQLAARYGSNKNVDPGIVRVAAGTEKKIGLGYVQYFENFNEPFNAGFTGKQFAAMLSADYDGHMGTLGSDVGVKAADPNAKVVFGGSYVTWFNITADGRFNDAFIVDMMAWFGANRTLEQWKAAHGGSAEGYVKYPFDVISVHGYSWDDSGNGISAEESRYYEKFKTFVDSCETAFPEKELFFSEFGWDTSTNSTNRASTPGLSTLETQGRWLVREFLLAAAAGLDRARQFMMPDAGNDPDNPAWFGTSGMIHGIQGSDNFKPSWYYVGTMRNVLKDASMNDIEILSDGGWTAGGGSQWVSETNGPWALRFGSLSSTDQIFALWLPTSLGDLNGENRQDYAITVPAGYKHATLVTLEDKVRWGVQSDISSRIQNGSLTVSITEKPIFVILRQEQQNGTLSNDHDDPHDFHTWAPTASDVLVNGEIIAFDAYNISDSTYFKLRDIAYVLNGTEKQFEVLWDSANNTITLVGDKPYTAVGGEMAGRSTVTKAIEPTKSKILLDGNEITITAYNIGGNNYFKLRDIGKALDFGVEWDSMGNNIKIDTSSGYN